MRTRVGGVVGAIVLLWSALASAQVSGVVDTIGFDGQYRPGCWTPMLVRLQSTGAPTGLYELRVWQHDLDGDTPYYSTRVTLTQGKGEQRFWTYFLPEPIHGGMTGAMSTVGELQQRLRITVHNAAGTELAQLALGASVPQAIDPILAFNGDRGRGRRFVVFVRDGGSAPPLRDYNETSAITGLAEDLDSVVIAPDRLPESSLGYDGVDAIVWLEGDPSQLSTGGSRRMEALREYVQGGGHLVLNTPPIREQLRGFDDLMPVDITGSELTPEATKKPGERPRRPSDVDRETQGPAGRLAKAMPFPRGDPTKAAPVSPWAQFTTPFTIATAKARPGTVVDVWSYRNDNGGPDDQTPWLARRPFGFGCVTWVGQDLGARELTLKANWGWPRVWEAVLGTASKPTVSPEGADKQQYQAASYREMGASVLDAMNLSGRATALVGVTILFFIGYWLIAGPGTYFFLRYRRRATLSWFWFGAVALGATAVTLGLVKLILRGDPEVKHISLVRIDADRNQTAMAISRLGVYVPRDGPQAIALTDTDRRLPSTITPFPIHPSLHAARDGDKYLFPAPIEYAVPVPTGDEPAAPTIRVPFRTTQKRLRADWFGPRDERIEGTASLRSTGRGGTIAGVLKNTTGTTLRNVYLAFRHRTQTGEPTDNMMYVDHWNAGDPLDLGATYNPTGEMTAAQITVGHDVRPNDRFAVRGTFKEWAALFGTGLTAGAMDTPVLQNDLGEHVPVSVPVLSLFGRLPPAENPQDGKTYAVSRVDLHRSGVRDWDASNALLAGQLVIVAQADQVPVPVPMTIDGDKVVGDGTTIYQFVLPLAPIPAAPSSQPATTQASN